MLESIDEKRKRTKLLEELNILSKDVPISVSTRKPRADKGVKRGPNANKRSDAGIPRPERQYVNRSERDKYAMELGRLLGRENISNEEQSIRIDDDGYYLPIVKENYVKNGNHSVINHHKEIARTVRHIKGYSIDLEKYRFNALSSLISTHIITPADQVLFRHEIEATGANDYITLFCRFYGISEENAVFTTYVDWIKSRMTPEDIEMKKTALLFSKEYTDYAAYVRDTEIERQKKPIRMQVYAEEEYVSLSLSQLEKVIDSKVDYDKVKEIVDKATEEWLNKKLEGE